MLAFYMHFGMAVALKRREANGVREPPKSGFAGKWIENKKT
jgi:hypothetical protein